MKPESFYNTMRRCFQNGNHMGEVDYYLIANDMVWWRCREKVVVPVTKPYITFEGAGRDVTVIEWHDRASDRGPNGQQLRTYRTASVSVFANYFSARNISFKV